jgi:hemerythrin
MPENSLGLSLRWSDRKIWLSLFGLSLSRSTSNVADEDHQKLFSLIQRLHDAIEAEEETATAQDALKELREHTKAHFSAEEGLMEQQTKYPGLLRHRVQHHTFIAKIAELERSLPFAPTTTPIALVDEGD